MTLAKIEQNPTILLIKTEQELNDLEHVLDETISLGEMVAIDIETPGQKSPHCNNPTILMVGIAIEQGTFVIPYRHPQSPLDPCRVTKFLQEYLPELKFVGQNTKFEVNWFKLTEGIPLYPYIDTMLLSHYVNETHAHNLTAIADRLFEAPPYDKHINYKTEPLDSYAQYCGLDCYYTLQAALLWKAYADEPYFRFIMETSHAITKMEAIGFTLDLDQVHKLENELKQEAADLKRSLPHIKDINFNSPQQVAKWLTKHGVTLTVRTASGAFSVSKDALLHVRNVPIVAHYLQWKRANELIKKFTSKWPQFVMSDKRVHASYFPLTETGRHRCSEPNVQQTPRDKRLRACWVPKNGTELVSWDISQVELRMAAVVAPEPHMANLFKNGIDIHHATAAAVVGRNPTDAERTNAKYINFGFLYGMGAERYQKQVLKDYGRTISLKEAQYERDTFYNTYPGIRAWHNKTINEVRANGYIRSIFGRMRHLPEAAIDDPEWHPLAQAINFTIQSPAADLTHAALVVTQDWPVNVVATIHDSILWEQPIGTDDDFAKYLIPQAMLYLRKQFGWNPHVPFEADWKIGDKWL